MPLPTTCAPTSRAMTVLTEEPASTVTTVDAPWAPGSTSPWYHSTAQATTPTTAAPTTVTALRHGWRRAEAPRPRRAPACPRAPGAPPEAGVSRGVGGARRCRRGRRHASAPPRWASSHAWSITAAAAWSTTRRRRGPRCPASARARSALTVVRRSSRVRR